MPAPASKEQTLAIAEMMTDENHFMSVQEIGKIFLYNHTHYHQLSSTSCDAAIHRLIMDFNNTLTPAKRDNVIRNIQALTAVEEQYLNPSGIFCFQDCIYDIKSDCTMSHSPDFKITIELPYNFRGEHKCEMWDKFLVDVTGGDQNKINLLQEFAGYCLMKSCHLEKALFLIGSGSNGKSVFSETIAKVFGRQNISSVSLESLANPVLRCNILGKFINIDSDLPRNAEKFEETFRKLTSGEPILFNEKFVPAYTAASTCKLIYCLNEFPVIDDASNAFYRRMVLVPFEVEFSDLTKDVNLKRKLEAELPGIFRWCINGHKRLTAHGFSKCPDMDRYIHEIRVDNNPIMAFVDSQVALKATTTAITKQGLYKAFKQWSMDHGHRCPSFRKFNRRFGTTYKLKMDDQMSTGSREKAWFNLAYQNQENAYEFGQREMGFAE